MVSLNRDDVGTLNKPPRQWSGHIFRHAGDNAVWLAVGGPDRRQVLRVPVIYDGKEFCGN